MTPANDNTPSPHAERPQWYDDLVAQFDPFLRNYSRTNFTIDEDLYQEAQIHLLRTWQGYREGKSIIPWMRYAVMSARRKLKKYADEFLAGTCEDIGSVAAVEEDRALCSLAISKLKKGERADLLLHAQGYTMEEIAGARGAQRQAAHGRIKSAIDRMTYERRKIA